MTFPVARRPLFLACLVILVGVDLAVASQATPPPPFLWYRNEQSKKELGLTAEQSDKINNIHQSMIGELRQEYDELQKCEAKLDKLLETSTDEALLARQIDRVESARANLNKTRSLMFARMRLVLSAEQRARLKVMAERWQAQNPRAGSDHRRPSDAKPGSDSSKR